MSKDKEEILFFPGCSLATSAKENYQSLRLFCRKIGYELRELPDWNCCGTSSAHSIDSHAALELASRNIALAGEQDTLLVACPSCYKQLKKKHKYIEQTPEVRKSFEQTWKTPFNDKLKIVPFLQFLAQQDIESIASNSIQGLKGLSFVPYYGCMLARPPSMNKEDPSHGLMEKVLQSLGAKPLIWPYHAKCCGTFLSVARPDIVTPMVNSIFKGAFDSGAECMVTACSMCHLNLEVRCSVQDRLPVFHFSELLCLALGWDTHIDWFKRHLIDPRPLLSEKGFIQ